MWWNSAIEYKLGDKVFTQTESYLRRKRKRFTNKTHQRTVRTSIYKVKVGY